MRPLALLLCGALMLPTVAAAQEQQSPPASPDAKARAKDLFSLGRAAFKARDFQKALEHFEASEQLFPAAGTRLNIAMTFKELGKLAEAMTMLDALVTELPDDDPRHRIAKSTRDAMAKHVPLMAIVLSAGAPKDADVLLDGEPFARAALGVERRVNPGAHIILVRSVDRQDRRYDVSLEPGARQTFTVDVGPPIVHDDATPPPLAPAVEEESNTTALGLGVAALILGAGGIAGGAITGAMALSNKSELDDSCPQPALCTQGGVDLAEEGQTLSIASTILFIGGGVFATAGVILTVVGASSGPQTEVAITPTSVTATLRF